MLDKNEIVKITNRHDGRVGYSIPELGNLRRSFASGETKEVTMDELRKLSYLPGGQSMLEKYFILDHNYKNGVCTVCGEDEDDDEDDSDDNSEYVDWEYIIENTENTFGTTTYDTKLSSKDTTVPYDVFDTLKGKKAVLNIKVNDIFSWSIKSGDIKTPKKLDLGVKLADKSIPLAVMSEYTKDYNYKELELSGSGDFGLKAQLTIDVGTINNGNKVDLYYYDPDDEDSLEFIATSKVESGKVTLPFTHASRYVIDMYKEKANDDEDDDDDDNETSGTIYPTIKDDEKEKEDK